MSTLTPKINLVEPEISDEIHQTIEDLANNFAKLDDLAENYAGAKPTSGFWKVSARVWNNTPVSGSDVGWVNTREGESAPKWEANKRYSVGEKIVPTLDNAHYYECKIAGSSVLTEPVFPTTANAEIEDKEGSTTWVAETVYALNHIVIPTTPNGFFYKCITEGTSGITEPVFTTTEDETVTDGTAEWKTYRMAVWQEKGVASFFIPITSSSGGAGDVTKAWLASDTGAGSVGAKPFSGIAGSTVQTILENLKIYTDSVKQALDIKDHVRVATNTEVNIDIDRCPLTVDGVALQVGNRILVKNGAFSTVAGETSASASAKRNGIYEVKGLSDTDCSLARTTDADTNTKVKSGMFVFVTEGTNNSDSGWVLSTDVAIDLETTNLAFVRFSGAGQILAGAGLTKNGNTIDITGTSGRIVVNPDSIDIASNYGGQTSIHTVGTIVEGTWTGNPIAITNGGTGATTASEARTNIGAITKFASDLGDGLATSYAIVHDLGTQDVTVMVRANATPFEVTTPTIEITDVNSVTLKFAVAPSANQYRVVITG